MSFDFGTPLPKQSALTRKLNPEQAAATFAPGKGAIVVSAVAGSGKTSGVILPRSEHLLKNDPEDKLLIMAFNKRIQAEIQEKVKTVISEDVNRRIDVLNSHSLAYRLVMANSKSLGLPKGTEVFDVYWKLSTFLRDLAKEERRKSPKPQGFDLNFCSLTGEQMEALMAVENEIHIHLGTAEELFGIRGVLKSFKDTLGKIPDDLCQRFIDWMQESRMKYGKLLFNDLIPLAVSLPDPVFKDLRYRHLLVDEAQDLSLDQHMLVQKLYKHAESVTFVGDACQSIYAFAGARPDIFDDIPKNYNTGSVFPLQYNYRSEQGVLDLANWLLRVYLESPNRMMMPVSRQSHIIQIALSPKFLGEEDEHHILAEEWGISIDHPLNWIRSKIALKVPLKEIAVLHRCNSDTLSLELDLLKAGIPYRSHSGSAFGHRAVEDIMAYLRFLRPDAEMEKEDWICLVNHIKFLGKQTAEEAWENTNGNPFKDPRPPVACRTDRQRNLYFTLIRRLQGIKKLLETSTIQEALSTIIKYLGEDVWPQRWTTDPKALEDARELSTTFIQWSEKLCTDVGDLVRVVNKIRDWIADCDPETSLTLSTIHKAKGLEWDYGVLWMVGSRMPLRTAYADFKEETCAFYVATTRFRKELFISADCEPKDLPYRMGEMLCKAGFLAPVPGSYLECNSCPHQLECSAKPELPLANPRKKP